ncbi:acyl carrier protein [Streptomyces sp. NPDC046870]|uniref:acyl carrier protein n=1 Tax=Streptomyces sp. NPDC046870 TaxID=3155135 RepID=UPI003455A24B
MDETAGVTVAPADASGTGEADVVRTVVDALSSTLGVPGGVDANDDFFELGGNSLLAAQTVALLRRRLGVKVTVRELFGARTATALAALIEPRVPAARS